jgi:O-antigen/teichoic acid export membrane protein
VIAQVSSVLNGNHLAARVLRSASWIILSYGASQAIRLAANLILTRLLYPEAFGLMALISVVTIGLMLFSDVGVGPSIAQSRRGDDPDFLDTAWTIQLIRGTVLWLTACLLAYPVAQFYGDPLLARYLPIAGLALVISGFYPTRIETAHRHLIMGRLTALDLASQIIGITTMIVLALALQSEMALVIGGVVGPAAKLVLTHLYLPGPRNRLRWEPTAANELVHFGKWIFLSTVFWFLASQGDKAFLGKFLSLDGLGVYNIGYFLAGFPLMLGTRIAAGVMIPIYREKAGTGDAKLILMRYGLTSGVFLLQLVLAFMGPSLVDLLYDARYIHSGAIVVLLSVAFVPQVIGMTYDQAALAAGDSRRFFAYSAARSTLEVSFLIGGAWHAGLIGALLGMGLARALSHLMLIWLARLHRVWDGRHDLTFAVLGGSTGAAALWMHWPEIEAMAYATGG